MQLRGSQLRMLISPLKVGELPLEPLPRSKSQVCLQDDQGFGSRINRDLTSYQNIGKRMLSPDSVMSRSLDRKMTVNRNLQPQMAQLFESGMGADPPALTEVGLRTPKLGSGGKHGQKAQNRLRDSSHRSGTFKIAYTQDELSRNFEKNALKSDFVNHYKQGLKIVDIQKLPAFLQNDYEKQNFASPDHL